MAEKTVMQLEELMNPTKVENKIVTNDDFAEFVKGRFDKMSLYRSDWMNRTQATFDLWDVHMDWLVDGEDFEKTVRFPTLRDLAMSMRDTILKNEPKADLEAVRGEKPERAQALKFTVDAIKSDPYEKRAKMDAIDDMLFYGIGFRKLGYRKVEKVKNGKKKIVYNNVGSERIDPRNVYLDDQGRYLYDPRGFDMKRDAIIKHEYHWSTFKDIFGDRDDVDISQVAPQIIEMDDGSENSPSTGKREDEEQRLTVKGVKVYEYYNQETDTYGIVANGATILQPRPIENNHGRIPLVAYTFEKRRDSFWGTSLAELVAPYIYLQDTMLNLEIKGLKLRLLPVMAIDKAAGFNPRTHKAAPGAVWELARTPGENLTNQFSPLPMGQTDSNGFYTMNSLIESQITVTTNIDRKALFMSPGELATQTALKNQSLNNRTNSIVFANEIEAESHYTELLVSDIKQYLSDNTDVVIDGKPTKRPRRIKVEGYVVNQSESSGDIKFTAKHGEDSYFSLTPEVLDVDVDVLITDMRSKALLLELKVGRLMQFLPVATNLVSSFAQTNPALMEKLDVMGIIEQTAEAMDMDLDRTLKDTGGDNQDVIENEHIGFIAGVDVPLYPEEDRKISREHQKEHLRFRYIFRKGKRTSDETELWKSMNKKSKDTWTNHMQLTVENIIAYKVPEAKQELPPVAPPTNLKQPAPTTAATPTQGGLSPEVEKALKRTLLQ